MLFPCLVTLLLGGAVCALIYIFLTWSFGTWKKRGVKGPKPLVFFGSFPNMIKQKRNAVYDMADIYFQYKHDESFVGVFSCRTPQLLILDPKIAREVFVSNFKSFHDNDASKFIDRQKEPVFGKNPFMLTGDEWKSRRAEITPGLTPSRIKASYPVMQSVCKKMTNFIKHQPMQRVNAKDISLQYTCEVVSDCVLGVEAGNFNAEKTSPIFEMANKLFNDFGLLFNIYNAMIAILPQLRHIYYIKLFSAKVEKFFVQLVKDAIDMRAKTNDDRSDFLNYLLELKRKKNLSVEDLTAHSITFFLDGFETSASVIAHTLLLLARNQEKQEKLRNEINLNVDEEGNLSFEQVNDLPYLEQCLQESLRLFSPLLYAAKTCSEECVLTNKNSQTTKIFPGQTVLIPVYALHHDKEFFPEPYEFIPERFSEENGGARKYRDAGVFLPFGDGPRVCLGMRFALAQTKSAIAEIVKNFKLTPNSKTRTDDELDPALFIASLNGGIWLDFEPIH